MTSVISYSPRADGCRFGGDLDHLLVVEVETGDRVVAPRPGGLLLDAQHLAGGVDLGHAVALGVADPVAEHRGARGPGGRALQLVDQAVAEEDVVAEHQRAGPAGHEVGTDDEGLGEPVGRLLHGVLEADAPLAAIAQQGLEPGLLVRGGDDRAPRGCPPA